MQAENAQPCIQCRKQLRDNVILYLISDMAEEMLAWVELKLKYKVNENSFLCEECFIGFRSTWIAFQEPEVIDCRETTVLGSDPLSESNCFNEDIQVKSEDSETTLNTIQHYDYQVEINPNIAEQNLCEDKSKDETLDAEHYEEKEQLHHDEKANESDVEMVSSYHDEASIKELSSDEEPTPLVVPPQLYGNTLNVRSNCDMCRISLKNKPYRILPDGPVKEIIVNKTFHREKSPERVCNPCWYSAYKAAEQISAAIKVRRELKMAKKNKKAKNDQAESESEPTIKVPGYQRFAKYTKNCIIRDCNNSICLRIPNYLRVVLLKFHNFYAAESARICAKHSKEYHGDWSCLKSNKSYITTFSGTDVAGMLDLLREDALNHPD